VAEPAGFLLHVLDGGSCVTHSVPASHTAAVRAFLSASRLIRFPAYPLPGSRFPVPFAGG
jgi:hypothetical protein